MNILGISGSPRRGGNSDLLLEKALEGARSKGAITENIRLNDLSFRPCQECGGCDKTGRCVIEDGMQVVYKKFEEADRVIIASPVFFGSLSAETKMMIDRFNCCWISKHLKDKSPLSPKKRKAIFFSVSASGKDGFFENSKTIIKNLFATLGIEYSGELYCGGVERKGDILRKDDMLKKAFEMGRELAVKS